MDFFLNFYFVTGIILGHFRHRKSIVRFRKVKILGNFATTGDGLLVALEILFSMRKGKKASEMFENFAPTPQLLENVEVKDKSIINNPKCKNAIKKANSLIKGKGRMLVRKSGTEPVVRIMCETEDKIMLSKCINIVKKSII